MLKLAMIICFSLMSSIALAQESKCSGSFDNLLFFSMNYSRDVGVLEADMKARFLNESEEKEISDRVEKLRTSLFPEILKFKKTCVK